MGPLKGNTSTLKTNRSSQKSRQSDMSSNVYDSSGDDAFVSENGYSASDSEIDAQQERLKKKAFKKKMRHRTASGTSNRYNKMESESPEATLV